MMTTPPDAPAIGSLWEHEDGERRFITDERKNGRPRLYFAKVGHGGTFPILLADWHAWAAKARRLA